VAPPPLHIAPQLRHVLRHAAFTHHSLTHSRTSRLTNEVMSEYVGELNNSEPMKI
jgi:hypothetical protein